MKRLLLFALIAVASCASAQTILVTKRDSTQFETRISANTDKDLFVPEGKIPMTDLLSVGFTLYSEGSTKLYDNLRKNGVVVYYDYKKGTKQPSTVPGSPLLVAGREPVSLDKVVISLNEFNNQRQIAKTLQLIGMVAIGGSAVMQAIYNQQYSDDLAAGKVPTQNFVPSAIPIAGTVLFTIGIGIDLSAGKHLKLVIPK